MQSIYRISRLSDCPGQIELYTHLSAMRQIVDKLKSWDFHIGAVFLMDSQFLVEKGKYLSGIMAALSTMGQGSPILKFKLLFLIKILGDP